MIQTPWPAEFEAVLRHHLELLDPAEPLTPGLRLNDFGLDSLSTVSLLLEIEETFGVRVPDESLTTANFSEPARLWATVEQLLPARA